MSPPSNRPLHALDDLEQALQHRSLRLTGPRRAVLAALQRQNRPVTINELHAALGPGECDLATVHRSVRLLRDLGLVQRVELGDGRSRFELIQPGTADHHHHLVCVRCAAVVNLEECVPRELEERVATRNGYRQVTHRLEFFGVCPECQ